jgi:oligopeptide/dipeptide ABC transporter ATP-binding protein
MNASLLEAAGLAKRYPVRAGWLGRSASVTSAVEDVSFRLEHGQTLGLVGESGSGKTTTARLVLRLVTPDSGRLLFEGEDWLALDGDALRQRRKDMQMVFQDPHTSLNPRMTVGDQIAEPLRVQNLATRERRRALVSERLAEVGLDASMARRFPGELSGGQRQRIAIARALATRPKLLVCDEPTSALDVSVAGQIVNLLLDLRDKSGLSMLFISHDLALVRSIADTIAVMYRGRIVEEGTAADVTSRPLHPYTAALLSAVGQPDSARSPRRIVLPPDSISGDGLRGRGCSFAPRCPIARPRCSEEDPPMSAGEPRHRTACFFPGELKKSV